MIAFACIAIAGLPISRAVDRDAPWLRSIAVAFLLVIGEWNDRLPSLFYPLIAGAVLLLIQSLLTDELKSAHLAAFATLALASPIATPWIGLGEGPFIAFAIAALLLIRRDSVTAGALLLGCAALTKNEGIALIVATLIAAPITRGS